MSIPVSREREKLSEAEISKSSGSKPAPKKPVPPKIIVFREGTDPKSKRAQK